MRKRLLHIAIHCWTSPIRVGSHSIAQQFVNQGWEVGYVSAPITPLNLFRLSSPVTHCRLKEMVSGGGWDAQNHLWHHVPFALIAPKNRWGLRSQWLFKNWQKLSFPNVLGKAAQYGFDDVDVLLMDSIYQPFWLSNVRRKHCIVRLSDFNAGFEGFGAGARLSEKMSLKEADLVISSSRAMCLWAQENGARETAYIPNGVDIERFSTNRARPVEYQSMKGKIAVFVGDVNDWVDLELIRLCARTLPLVNFVMIGPIRNQRITRGFPSNVKFLGIRPFNQIPAYLFHGDVGLIPFHQEQFQSLVQHINPLKLYEYFAAGLPVVSTYWPEIDALSSPVRLCKGPEEFVAATKAVLDAPINRTALLDYAQECSWQNRLAKVFSWLERNE